MEIRETDLRSLFRALICLSVLKYQSQFNPELTEIKRSSKDAPSGNVSPDCTVVSQSPVLAAVGSICFSSNIISYCSGAA